MKAFHRLSNDERAQLREWWLEMALGWKRNPKEANLSRAWPFAAAGFVLGVVLLVLQALGVL